MKALIVLLGALCLIACGSAQPSTHRSASPAAPSSPTAPKTLYVANGSGDYMSGPFATHGDWELDWSYNCAKVTDGHSWLIVAVYRTLDTDPSTAGLFDTVTPSPSQTFGVNLENHATSAGPTNGSFYVKVSSECDWHLIAK